MIKTFIRFSALVVVGLVALPFSAIRPAAAQEDDVQRMVGRAFNRFDDDNSGDLDDGEFKRMANAAMRQRGAQDLSGLDASEAFQKFDLNQDGLVDKGELAFFMETMQSL